jgi:hypothetical protein
MTDQGHLATACDSKTPQRPGKTVLIETGSTQIAALLPATGLIPQTVQEANEWTVAAIIAEKARYHHDAVFSCGFWHFAQKWGCQAKHGSVQ